MLKWKTLDLFAQLLLILLVVLALSFFPRLVDAAVVLLVFAIVQTISILLHLGTGKTTWKKVGWRKFHHFSTLIILALLAYAILKDKENPQDWSGLNIAIYATIPAILLALFYTVITYREWRNLKTQ